MTIPLVVYGDFNCPYSALASLRATDLERRGIATVDWRAVDHAPDIPAGGRPVDDEARAEFRRELDEVASLLVGGESLPLRAPTTNPNTRLAAEAYAATPPGERAALRARLFAAHWFDGEDIGDPATLTRLGAGGRDADLASRWRAEWAGLPRTLVPIMVLPDGTVSRGLGALARLVRMREGDEGGEAPCLAPIVEPPGAGSH